MEHYYYNESFIIQNNYFNINLLIYVIIFNINNNHIKKDFMINRIQNSSVKNMNRYDINVL